MNVSSAPSSIKSLELIEILPNDGSTNRADQHQLPLVNPKNIGDDINEVSNALLPNESNGPGKTLVSDEPLPLMPPQNYTRFLHQHLTSSPHSPGINTNTTNKDPLEILSRYEAPSSLPILLSSSEDAKVSNLPDCLVNFDRISSYSTDLIQLEKSEEQERSSIDRNEIIMIELFVKSNVWLFNNTISIFHMASKRMRFETLFILLHILQNLIPENEYDDWLNVFGNLKLIYPDNAMPAKDSLHASLLSLTKKFWERKLNLRLKSCLKVPDYTTYEFHYMMKEQDYKSILSVLMSQCTVFSPVWNPYILDALVHIRINANKDLLEELICPGTNKLTIIRLGIRPKIDAICDALRMFAEMTVDDSVKEKYPNIISQFRSALDFCISKYVSFNDTKMNTKSSIFLKQWQKITDVENKIKLLAENNQTIMNIYSVFRFCYLDIIKLYENKFVNTTDSSIVTKEQPS